MTCIYHAHHPVVHREVPKTPVGLDRVGIPPVAVEHAITEPQHLRAHIIATVSGHRTFRSSEQKLEVQRKSILRRKTNMTRRKTKTKKKQYRKNIWKARDRDEKTTRDHGSLRVYGVRAGVYLPLALSSLKEGS